MNIYFKNRKIHSLAEWEQTFSPKQWKEHHSAWALAQFVIGNNGISAIEQDISEALAKPVTIECAAIECAVPFDAFPRHSMRDMVLTGKTSSGERVFVAIEAKVEEPFGKSVKAEYVDALKDKLAHPNSKKSERIENLLSKIAPEEMPDKSSLKYQLFHATAATISKDAEFLIMMALSFDFTDGYVVSPSSRNRNKSDFKDFMNAVHASLDTSGKTYSAKIAEKDIRFIYLDKTL